MIPKIIHYCWFGGKEKPESFIKILASWRKFCPDFEIKEWNETNYDISKHPFMVKAAADGKWSFVSDYARLDILHMEGGIYLDTDVEVIKDLSPLCAYKGFFGFQNYDLVNDGHGFGCEPGLPVIKEMRDIYDTMTDNIEYIESPRLRTQVLLNHGLILNGGRQQVADLEILPQDYLSPKNYMTGRLNITENTYSIHYCDCTWKSAKEKKYDSLNRFCCRIFGEKKGHKVFVMLVNAKDKIKTLFKR